MTEGGAGAIHVFYSSFMFGSGNVVGGSVFVVAVAVVLVVVVGDVMMKIAINNNHDGDYDHDALPRQQQN